MKKGKVMDNDNNVMVSFSFSFIKGPDLPFVF